MDHFDELWPENAKNDQILQYRLFVDVRNLVWWGSCHGISVSMNSSPNFEIAPKRHFVKMLRTASDERLRDPDLAVTLIHSAMHSAARGMIEAGSDPQKVRTLRADLIRMCRGYVREAPRLKADN
jgi:hypothetical protein